MKTLVVIPSKNLEDTIGRVVANVKSLKLDLDVLVVNDGSPDETSQVARDAGATVIDHPTNLGKGEALKTGYEYSLEKDYDAVCQRSNIGCPSAAGKTRLSHLCRVEVSEPVHLGRSQDAESHSTGLKQTHDLDHVGRPRGADKVGWITHGV